MGYEGKGRISWKDGFKVNCHEEGFWGRGRLRVGSHAKFGVFIRHSRGAIQQVVMDRRGTRSG